MSVTSPWPQRTTLVAGTGLVLAAVALLCDAVRPSIALLSGTSVPLFGPLVSVPAHLVLVIAFTVMGCGIGHEVGLAGTSRRGRAYLVVWGSSAFVLDLVLVGPWQVQAFPDVGVALRVLQLAFGTIGLLAAHSVSRARVLGGIGRWVLLPLAVLQLALVVVRDLAVLVTAIVPVLQALYLVEVVSILSVGLVLLFFGRIEAIRYRASTIRENW